jgi:hypothetical protein
MSELHQKQLQRQQWSSFSPPGNALQVVGSAPAAPGAAAAAAGDSAAVAGSSAPRTNSQGVRTTPSPGGLASWLAAGSKASFVLKGAGGGRRKSAAGKGLRLLQQRAAQHRPVQLTMPAVPTALPCELCVPQLPPESFGELRSGIAVAVLESCLTLVKDPSATWTPCDSCTLFEPHPIRQVLLQCSNCSLTTCFHMYLLACLFCMSCRCGGASVRQVPSEGCPRAC